METRPTKQFSNSSYIMEETFTIGYYDDIPWGASSYSSWDGDIDIIQLGSNDGSFTQVLSQMMTETNKDDGEEEWNVNDCPVRIMDEDKFTPFELAAVRTLLRDWEKNEALASAFEICANKGKTVEIWFDGFVHHGDGTTESWASWTDRSGLDTYGGFATDEDGSDILRISLNPYEIHDAENPMEAFQETLIHEVLHIKWQLEFKHERLESFVPGAIKDIYGEGGDGQVFDGSEAEGQVPNVVVNVYGGSPLDPARFDKGVVITGTANDDTITGHVDALNDISGGAGDDILTGSNLADYINGGSGNDNIKGGDGDDLIIPGQGLDDLWGGLGDDYYLFLVPSTLNNNIHDIGGTSDWLEITHSNDGYYYDYQDGSGHQVVIDMENYTTTFIENGQNTGAIENMIFGNGSAIPDYATWVAAQSSSSAQVESATDEVVELLAIAGYYDALVDAALSGI